MSECSFTRGSGVGTKMLPPLATVLGVLSNSSFVDSAEQDVGTHRISVSRKGATGFVVRGVSLYSSGSCGSSSDQPRTHTSLLRFLRIPAYLPSDHAGIHRNFLSGDKRPNREVSVELLLRHYRWVESSHPRCDHLSNIHGHHRSTLHLAIRG